MGAGYDIRIVANVTRRHDLGIDQLDDRRRDPVRQPQRSRATAVKPSTSNTSTKPTRRSKLLRARPGGTYPTRARSGPASTCSRRRPAPPRRCGSSSSRTTIAPGAASRIRASPSRPTSPRTNKPLTAACQGLKVAVVLDESGSIGSAAPQVRNATKALARGLVDTGARMAVFKFSTTADPSFIAPYKTITQAWIDGNNPGDLDYYLDRYDPGGTTNWDAGLDQARDQTAADKPDLVVFLTDGNPNRWAGGGTGVEEGFYSAMDPAANVANQLKANSHMFAIGVGAGVTDALSALRIQAVSGTRSFPEYSIETADYTLVTELRRARGCVCRPRLQPLQRHRDGQEGNGRGGPGRLGLRSPAGGSAAASRHPPGSSTTGGSSRTRSTPSTQAPRPSRETPIAGGTLDFVWRPTSATALSNITISETAVPATFEPESVTVHLRGHNDPRQRRSGHGVVVHPHGPEGARPRLLRRPEPLQTLDRPGGQELGRRSRVGDDLRRRERRRAVTTPRRSRPRAARAPPSTTRSRLRSGWARPPCRPAIRPRSTAAAALQPYTGGPFPVTSPPTDGATLTCTITNKQLRSTVQVVKNWVGTPVVRDDLRRPERHGPLRRLEGGDSERPKHLLHLPDLDAGDRRRDRRAVGLRGDDPVRHGRRAGLHGRPVRGHLTGYRRRNHHLHDHQQAENLHGASGQGLGRRPLDDDDLRRPGRRRTPFDASTVATATGDSASFTYPISTPVTVGETPVPAGYAATIRCGEGTAQPYTGAPFPVTSPAVGGSTITCTITNTQQLSSVRVVKEWVGAPSTTTIFVDATGAAPFDASTSRLDRRQRLLHLPDLDSCHGRRGRPRPGWLRGHDPMRHRRSSRLHRRPVRGHVTRNRRSDHHLQYRQYPAALEGSSNQELVRYADQRDDLRGPERRGALRRLHVATVTATHVLQLPGLHAGVRRRDRLACWVHRDDPVRCRGPQPTPAARSRSRRRQPTATR